VAFTGEASTGSRSFPKLAGEPGQRVAPAVAAFGISGECRTFAQTRRALLDADEPTISKNQCSASEYEIVVDVATEEVGTGTANEVQHPEDNARR
jgi:hypothetical protein